MITGVGVISMAPAAGQIVAALLMVAGNITAAVLIYRETADMQRREKVAWRLIGTAFGLAATTILALAVYAEFNDVGAYSFFDTFFLLSYVFMISGMLLIRQAPAQLGERVRLFVDGAIGAISFATMAWLLFVRDIVEGFVDAPVWDRFVGSAYPILDIVMVIIVMIMLLRRTEYRFDYRLVLLAAGVTFQVAADLSFLTAGLDSSYVEAQPNYVLFLGAFLFYLLTAIVLHDTPPERELAERSVEWWPMVAPYASAGGMLLALFVSVASDNSQSDVLWLLVASLAVAALVFFRQAHAIKTNRELVENERTALISTVSHELRTPLTAMVGFLELLSEPDLELSADERIEMTGVVDQQAKYMSRIVSDLVLLARGRPELMNLESHHIGARTIADRAVQSTDPGEGEIRILAPADLVVDVDSDRIQQALVNLLTNAVRYGGERRLVVVKRSGNDVAFEVHDDGEGVPKRYERLVWDRFERGVHRLNSTKPGSGIGLAIVKAIAQAHGGRVAYRRSEVIGGACFTFSIPGAAVPAPAIGAPNIATNPA